MPKSLISISCERKNSLDLLELSVLQRFILVPIFSLKVVVRDSCSGDPIVVASLSDGNYFGEISLLRLDGGTNRYASRTSSIEKAEKFT